MKHLSATQFKQIQTALNPHNQGGLIQAINARDLHSYLGVGTKFSDWIKARIEKYGFTENIDYVTCSPKLGSELHGGQNKVEYHLSPDMSKQLGMVENNEQGRLIRLYYIDLETKTKEQLEDKRVRATVRVEYQPMTDAILESREGKETKFYHFSNEADCLNRIALGCTSSEFKLAHGLTPNDATRDYLTTQQKNCLIALQRANTVYLGDNLPFDERKAKLTDLYNRKWKDKLIEEHFLLEA